MERASSRSFDKQRSDNAGDEAGEEGFDGRDEGGTGAGGDESGEPAVGAEAGVGLAEAEAGDGEGGGEGGGGREQGIDGGDRQGGWGGAEPEERAGKVPREPADQGEEAAEEDVDGVVAGHGGGKALFGEFATAGTGDPDDGEGAEAAKDDGRWLRRRRRGSQRRGRS